MSDVINIIFKGDLVHKQFRQTVKPLLVYFIIMFISLCKNFSLTRVFSRGFSVPFVSFSMFIDMRREQFGKETRKG